MSREKDSKRVLSDDEILKFIEDTKRRRVTDKNEFEQADAFAMAYTTAEFVDAVEVLLRFPSADKIAMFRYFSTDPGLVNALDEPHIMLAAKLKEAYDHGSLPFFDMLMDFKARNTLELDSNGLIRGKQDHVMVRFKKETPFFVPTIPEIRNVELKSRVFSNNVSGDLVNLGRGRYQAVVSELLALRFPDQGIIRDITKYLFSRSVTATWSIPFMLSAYNKVDASDLFYQYIGALSLSNMLQSDKLMMKNMIAVLIEPIACQFDETKALDFPKEELEKTTQITYETIHTATYSSFKDKVQQQKFLVHAYAGQGHAKIMIGTGLDSSEEGAQKKAAANATHRESQLNRLLNNLGELQEYYSHTESVEPVPINVYNNYSTSQAPPPRATEPVYGGVSESVASSYMNPSPLMTTRSMPPAANTIANPHIGTALSHPPNSLINAELQRQKQADMNKIILVPDIEDDASIDKSSKEKLNHMLLERRYATADYKTSKISNSDVQVICSIENIPMTRAISTNKKKAGQLCAQFILNYSDYFLARLPPR